MKTQRAARFASIHESATSMHLPSHARLLRNASNQHTKLGRSHQGRLDAVIVPATRPASALAGIIDLAAGLETTIVVLCSRQAHLDQIARCISRTTGARGIVVQIDEGYILPDLGLETLSNLFTAARGGRLSDLSVKRNLGLLMSRLHGWRKIAFIDDDITLSRQGIARIAYQLDSHQIAGMACRAFPDNSVVCHARRLARLKQDVFITGAVLGVNCSDLPIPFFPDIYNEDWFFFAEAAAHRRLIKVGEARQATYNPYAEPARASHEEFGDLLAEGLYSLIENPPVLIDPGRPTEFLRKLVGVATESYWSSFADARRHDLGAIRSRLENFASRDTCSDDAFDAIKSVEAAEARYDDSVDPITPEHCVNFLEAWLHDIVTWNRSFQSTNTVRNTGEALKRLQLATWTTVR